MRDAEVPARAGWPAAVLTLACLFACVGAFRRVFEAVPAWSAAAPLTVVFGVTMLASRGRVRLSALLAGLATTALGAVAVAAVLGRPRSGSPFVDAATSLTSGWARILTTTLPAAPTPQRLPVVTLVGGVCACAAALALHSRRPVAAVLPCLGAFLAGLVLGVGGEASVVSVAGPVAVTVLGVVLVTGHRGGSATSPIGPRPPLPTQAPRSVSAVVVVAVVTVAALWCAPRTPHRPPADLRDRVEPPTAVSVAADPVALLSQRLTFARKSTMFTAEVPPDVALSGRPWRLAAFDTYDGSGWSSSRQARSVGKALAPTMGSAQRVRVRVVDLAGPWVPTTGRPVRVTPGDLRFEPWAGALLDVEGVRPWAVYDELVELSADDPVVVASAPVGEDDAASTAPVCLPKALSQLVTRVDDASAPPAQRAQALAEALATLPGAENTVTAPPGSSCARVAALLTGRDRRGTSEQFATAFVLAARSVGLPARLAVGFRPGAAQDPSAGAATVTVTVTGADAFAWPEVLLGAGVGWTPFDPTPSRLDDERPEVADALLQPAPLPSSARPVPPLAYTPPQVRHQTPTSERTVWVVVLGWLSGGLLAVASCVVAAAVPVTRRRRRRARRRAPDARTAIAGAWAELLDRLHDLEVRAVHGTATGVAAAVVKRCPAAAADVVELAGLVNSAVYDPRQPRAEDAARAWCLSDAVVTAVRRASAVRTRLRAVMSVRAVRRPAQVVVAEGDGKVSESPLTQTNGPVVTLPPNPVGAMTTRQ